MQAQKNVRLAQVLEKKRNDISALIKEAEKNVVPTPAQQGGGRKKKKKSTMKTRSQTKQPQQVEDYAHVLQQMIMPINCGGGKPLKATPNSAPSQVCVRHLHKVIDVDSSLANMGNGFTVLMNPNLEMPGYITGTVDALYPSIPGTLAVTGKIFPTNDQYDLNASGAIEADETAGMVVVTDGDKKSVIEMKIISDSALYPLRALQLTPLAASVATITLINQGTRTVKIGTYTKTAAGVWTAVPAPTTLTSLQTASTKFTIAANSDALGFQILGQVDNGQTVKIEIGFDSAQIVAQAVNSLVPGFSTFINENVSWGRVISMSVLATNTSSALNNGGTINGARVPRTLHPFGANLASKIADLPENRRYQGPASEGTYVTWLPSQEDEFEVNGIPEKIQSYANSEFILVRVDGWPAGASFRIQFDWVVEFYTTNQLFEKQITPPMTDAFRQLHHLALTLDAATCNPGHLDLLRDFAKKGLFYGRKAIQFYGENQKLIDGVLSLVSSMV